MGGVICQSWRFFSGSDAINMTGNGPGKRRIIMSKGQSLQDPFLNALRRERVPVSIYLVNGIKLQGTVESFDQFVVLLRNTSTPYPRSCRVETCASAASTTRAMARTTKPSKPRCLIDREKVNAHCCCRPRRLASTIPR